MLIDFITALTGSPDTVVNWRVVNDRDKSISPRNLRGTIEQMLPTLTEYNQAGWGIFISINAMDEHGQSLVNVTHIRTHVVDLDNIHTSAAMYEKAIQSDVPPHMVVNSSENKYHLYWLVNPYQGNDFYSRHQRKLAQIYDGDFDIIDASRIMRAPGFYHRKGDPFYTTFKMLHNHPRYDFTTLEQHLAHVNVVESYSNRHELGDPKLAAPSLDWLVKALNMIDPNELSRGEWLAASAAFKQAGWTLTSEENLIYLWSHWCGKYHVNDESENLILWRSLNDTQVGWGRFERITNIKPYIDLGVQPPSPPFSSEVIVERDDDLGEILEAWSKKIWFKDCYFIERMGEILTPSGRFMNSTQFNGAYGGKAFTVASNGGKITNEAWAAALKSTDWVIPKVDHVRFLPENPPFSITMDRRGRKGLNTYMPVILDAAEGDVTAWLNHIKKVLPNEKDQKIFKDYLAHIVKYPGYKVPWAILLQGVEGLGKSVFFEVLQHALGDMYVYRPKAPELIASGSKFNAWMRSKLAIVVDEIKIDERRELIEILKPMITDKQIEIQAKGVDQEMEDNCANWLFFSNYKDAIPVSQNGRRYCVFYSVLQTRRDLIDAGMDKKYFDDLWDWLRNGGLQAVTYWLLNYPIEKGQIDVNAPQTSSHLEALKISRSPVEVLLDEKIEVQERGFRGGYISWPLFIKAIENSKIRSRPPEHVLISILESRGYHDIGYYTHVIGVEDMSRPPLLYAIDPKMGVKGYEIAQSGM